MPKSSNQFWECNFLQSFSSAVGSSWMLIRFNYLFFWILSGLPHSLWLLSLSFTSLTSSSLSGNSWFTSHMVIYVKKVSSGHFTYLLGVSVQPYCPSSQYQEGWSLIWTFQLCLKNGTISFNRLLKNHLSFPKLSPCSYYMCIRLSKHIFSVLFNPYII